MSAAALQTCARCRVEESIPTHQHVKCDGEVHYLCLSCWEGFRRWFHGRAASSGW